MKTSNNWLRLGLQRQSTVDEEDQQAGDETAHELSSSDTSTVRILSIDEDSTYTVEESTGVDPYNTGRFDATKS